MLIHGYARKGKTASEYYCWQRMKERCNNQQNPAYPRYGGRGIKVCKRWMKFENFIADMGCKPGPKFSIDRFPDCDGNYEPGNCRWATTSQQVRNRRPYRWRETKGYVFVRNRPNPWIAQIWLQGRNKYLGCFATKEEAHAAYEKAKNAQG